MLVAILRELVVELNRRRLLRNSFPGSSFESNVVVKGPVRNLRLGRDVIIQSGTVLHVGGMAWCAEVGHIEIGDGGTISPNCVLYGAGPGGLRVGRRFDCGPGVGIFASRTDYLKGPGHHVFAPVTIGDDVIVYANAVISLGVTIGSGAAVAAGAIVTRDVPPRTLVGGAPARPLRRL